MKLKFSQHVARLARSLWRSPIPRAAARPHFRPTLECLEDRTLLSALSVLNLDNAPGMTNIPASGVATSGKLGASSPGMTTARSASLVAPGAMVFRATDVPQPVDFPDVFTTSFINVPQSVAIASLKVQLDITYPLDNDLTIDLIAPDGTDVPLSSFEGTGANFQNTTFDDNAATPIWAGNSPFAGSYRPESPLSALAGHNVQGTWELQIIDWGASAGTLNSWSLIVQPAGSPAPAASSLTVSGFPSSTTAGQAGSFTVTARDANGNVATGYTGTVHFASSDPQAGLPADYTFTAADGGSHTFSVALKTAGTQSFTVTDTAASGLTGTESGIAVSPAAASRLVVSTPTGATAGAAFSITVTAQDAFGNTATGYTGTVHFSSSDGQAVLPVNSTLRNGTGTFSAALKTAGSESLTATDTASGTITGSASLAVSPAAATSLLVTVPASVTAGGAFSVAVTARDAYGNRATGYTGTVHISSSDTAAGVQLPADYTFTAADRGQHLFRVVLQTVGSQTITATDTVSGSITGRATVSVVAPTLATHLAVHTPSGITAGSSFSITVTALDANGNTVTGYTGTVQFRSSDGRATLPASYTFTAADKGVHTFSGLVLDTAGTQTVTVSDNASSAITGRGSVAVSPAAASHLAVSVPAGATAGTAFSITVTAQDAFGNTATGYTGTVHFSSSDGQAVLPVNSTLLNGTGTFSVTLKTAGSEYLTATDTASSQVTGSASLAVSPAVSGALVFHSTDVPQTIGPISGPSGLLMSVINVPQNVTIASLKVQLDITYPLDSDLVIDVVAPTPLGNSTVQLSYQEGTGANFQNTIFDDAAATPIGAGASPFAGSYRPEVSLSSLAGSNAQGTWTLEVVDFGGGFGTLNSWSLIIQPAGSPTTLLATAPSVTAGTSPHATAPSPPRSLVPAATPAHVGLPAAGAAIEGSPGLVVAALNATPLPSSSLPAGNTLIAGQAPMDRGLISQGTPAGDVVEPADAGDAFPLLHLPGHRRLIKG
jgi:subtilisin-like proprotein convertase family protein